MRTTLLMLAMLATPAFAGQTVWKWVDENGVTHYSDRAIPGATRMELNVAPAVGTEVPAASSGSSSSTDQQDAGPPYRNFEIWKPAQDDTIANTGGVVDVNIRIDPPLRAGHTAHLYLDGKLVEGNEATTEYSLTQVPRGQHTLVALIRNRRGATVQETTPVAFTVRQESVANPPVGPALRPQPKPRPGGGGMAKKLPTAQPSYVALNGDHRRIDPATNQPVKAAVPKP